MNTNLFIVPYDFTSVGDTALKYAIFLAKPKKRDIIVLHVVDKPEKSAAALAKLNEVISLLDLSIGDGAITAEVIVGSIFEDIPDYAKKVKARLIVMGTHGALGMQKLFGSYAMKVITNSDTPFLIIQDGVSHHRLNNMVIPITFSKESLQIMAVGITIAQNFGCKIHVVSEHYSDRGLYQRIKVRMDLVKKQFNDFNIDHQFELIKNRSFQKGIISYAKDNDCDLIALAHYSDSLIPQLDRFTQGLITNKDNIPCLVVNAKLLTKLYF